MIEQLPEHEEEIVPSASEVSVIAPPRFRTVRRAGCLVLLVFWFALLLSPCFAIVLATQGQITISQGDLPEQEIRIWLIMEDEQRGIGFSSTAAHPLPEALGDHSGTCVQTDVHYVLWQGDGQATTYCSCWAKDSANDWELLATYSFTCPN